MKKKIIMVSGYKDAGKDHVADELYKVLRDSDVVAFATPMKDILSVMFGISKDVLDRYKNNADEVLMGSDINGHNHTDFRTVIQKFGSEAMKPIFGYDVWVNLLLKTVDTLSSEYIIISDWRFINEYEGVNDLYEVITVRVDNHNLIAGDHVSEHQLDNFQFDYRLDNTAKDKTIVTQILQMVTEIYDEVI